MASIPSSDADHDVAVRDTASDASLCKLSACQMGYYVDPFIQFFVKAPSRRMPIINRGYYARVAVIETLVRKFLATEQPKKQVVILGAGLDTMFFRLKSTEVLANCEYFELDFPDVTMQKVSTIKRRKPLMAALELSTPTDFMAAVSSNCTELNVPGYHLLPCDLRDLDATTAKMEMAGIDHSVPTLFVSECVLIYMEAKFSTQFVVWARSFFDDVSFALYEQILPNDAFGKVMMANIDARGCNLLSIYDYPTIEAQITRFTSNKYEVAQCWDMNKVYYHYLDPSERVRRERLEIFDELEEFHMLQAHYCVVVASNKASSSSARALSLGDYKT
ncbi:leucine carboxyl [Plasmopara halstedii]|uniref:Leucine carboxyl methyltransferase 1 n=1 Tax=Plasmopara halstedii TaxID=4781 RepID=A0A0P1AFY7_PLAHL|nr:leucine carboxyl [Plasmopara halstedii]CEG39655.1 leucine carboxyl [Plasmopara halstedii]|eukprot:XP_024576024.1 leucine carboxyl [Plasmopara halstedii]